VLLWFPPVVVWLLLLPMRSPVDAIFCDAIAARKSDGELEDIDGGEVDSSSDVVQQLRTQLCCLLIKVFIQS
jgi:hypothetical protein